MSAIVDCVAESRGVDRWNECSEISGPCAAVGNSVSNNAVIPYKSSNSDDHFCQARPSSRKHTVDDDEDDNAHHSCASRLISVLSDCENSALTSECHEAQRSRFRHSSVAFMSPALPTVHELQHQSFRVSLMFTLHPCGFS